MWTKLYKTVLLSLDPSSDLWQAFFQLQFSIFQVLVTRTICTLSPLPSSLYLLSFHVRAFVVTKSFLWLNWIHLTVVLSTPIPVWSSIVVNKPAVNDADSQARVAAYHEADATGRFMYGHRGERFTHAFSSSAKDMVSKMVTVANSGKPEHQKIVNDAFGPIANRNKIKATIHNLNTQQVRVRTTDVVGINHDLVATTPVTRPNGPTGPIKLGPNFFGKFSAIFTMSPILNVPNVSIAADSSKEYRAGTLIHEATHQQSHTGDLINNKDRIVGTLEDQKNDIKMQRNGRPHIGCMFAPFPLQVRVHGFS